MIDVRQATTADAKLVASILGSAFERDPVFSWLTPARNRRQRLERFFDALARSTMGSRGEVFVTGDGNGAAVWLPPGGWSVPPAEIVKETPTFLRTFGRRLPRMAASLLLIEKKHPTDVPHWYLEFLGTRREVQRKGVGTTVITSMLDRCDDEGLPAYLEASSTENVPFYRRHGFDVTEEIKLPRGPSVWAMWREPR